MEDASDELWTAALNSRIDFHQSHIQGRPVTNDPARDAALLSNINDTLALLHTHSARLKSCVNAMLPVSLLSSDLLSLIFRFLAHDLPLDPFRYKTAETFEGAQITSPLSTWVKVTHVSRFWRQVALSDAALWTDVYAEYGETWAKAFLERSGSHMVSLHVRDCALTDVYAEAISRAHTLDLVRVSYGWREHLLNSSAKALTRLFVDFTADRSTGEEYGYERECPSRFFTHDPDGLCELHLQGFENFQWMSMAFPPTLTALTLGLLNHNNWAQVHAPLDTILNTLSQLQALRSLKILGISDITEEAEVSIDSYTDTVSLPHLQLLRVELCHPNTVLALFNSIVTPADANVHLVNNDCWWDHTYHGVASPLKFIDILRRRLTGPSWNNLQTLVASYLDHLPSFMKLNTMSDDEAFTIMAWRGDVDPHHLFHAQDGDDVPQPEPDFYFDAVYYEHEEHYLSEMVRAFGPLPVRTLCLLPDPELRMRFLSSSNDLHDTFPALSHLVLANQAISDVLRWMLDVCQTVSSPTWAPNLRKLTLLPDSTHTRRWEEYQTAVPYSVAQGLTLVDLVRSAQGIAMDVYADGQSLDRYGDVLDRSILHPVALYSLAG